MTAAKKGRPLKGVHVTYLIVPKLIQIWHGESPGVKINENNY